MNDETLKEINSAIEDGDNECLGWKDKHYLRAIALSLREIAKNKRK